MENFIALLNFLIYCSGLGWSNTSWTSCLYLRTVGFLFLKVRSSGLCRSIFPGWLGWWKDARYCLVRSSACCLSGRTLVSWWRWSTDVILVHPVAVLSAWFWSVCRRFQWFCAIIGPKIGMEYSRLDLMVDLYMMVMDSLSWPQSVPASAFRALSLVLPVLTMVSMCCPNLYYISKKLGYISYQLQN